MAWGSNKLHFTYDSTGPASVTYNGNRYFYLKNAQGDVTGLVNASGTQVVSYTYDPWGAPMSTDGTMASTLGAANPLRYRGYVYDTETGLYYLSSRYYNPVWGRFINADGYASTGQGFTGYNMFAYCNGNPLRNRDSGGSLPHNTMTMMTDGGTRDENYWISRMHQEAKKNGSLDAMVARGKVVSTNSISKDGITRGVVASASHTELPMNGFEIDADMFSVEASASLSSKKVSIGAGAYVARASVLIYIPLDISVSIGVYVGPGFSFGYGEKGFGFSASSLIGFSFEVCWDDD